ncbi:hypothetical protein [Colwellia sp. MT41]|nr:hypothetical protein [Colwellia sp. MT41]
MLITNPAWLNNSEKLQWRDTIFIEKDKLQIISKKASDLALAF